MSHTLTLRWSNHAHPWLQGMRVAVAAAGAGTGLERVPGHREVVDTLTVTVPDGVTEVDVVFAIRTPVSGHGATRTCVLADSTAFLGEHGLPPFLWLLRGRYRVEEGALHTVAVQWPPGPDGVITGGVHARAEERSVGCVHTVDVDLAFLDATEVVRRAQPTWPGDLHGCAIRAYQLLDTPAGGGSTVVGVLVPDALRDDGARDAIDTLAFFCPKSRHTYSDAQSLNIGSFIRYVGDPPTASEWGFEARERDLALVLGEPQVTDYPSCRFAAQLKASGRKALLVMPFADSGDFSPWRDPQLTRRRSNGRAASLLDALLRALQDDGRVGARLPVGHVVRTGRLGIGGFSFGGTVAVSCFQQNRPTVTDLFLFDPVEFDDHPTRVSDVCSWASRPGHRLRIIGGALLPALRSIAERALRGAQIAALGPPPEGATPATFAPTYRLPPHLDRDASVLLFPSDPAFWQRSPDYAYAFRTPWDPILTAPGQQPAGALSGPARVFVATGLDARNHQSLSATLPDGTAASSSLSHVAAPEAAALLLVKHYRRELLAGEAVTSQADLDTLTHAIHRKVTEPTRELPWPRYHRHQWTVFGGQSAGDRHDPATFKGYLQLCLETSSFAH